MASGVGQLLKRLWKQVPLNKLQQGSSLTIRSKIPLNVRIEPSWRDDGVASLSSVLYSTGADNLKIPDMQVDQSETINTSLGRNTPHVMIDVSEGLETLKAETLIGQPEGLEQPVGNYLTIQTPEKFNFVCDLSDGGGSISITEKIEGDVKCKTLDGDITVKKLRGHTIELETKSPESLIFSSSLLETQKLSVKTNGRFRAKQIHANVALIDVDAMEQMEMRLADEDDDEGSRVDISSLFITGNGGASIAVRGNKSSLDLRAVRVKSHHGPLRVETDGVYQPTTINPHTNDVFPIVEIGGANGSTEIDIRNSKQTSETDWSSCLLHIDSLPQNSVSLVSADSGDISLTLDRKTEADLRFASLANAGCLKEAGALLAEEEDSILLKSVLGKLPSSDPSNEKSADTILIETRAFTETTENSLSTTNVVYKEGWVENKSEEPDSRFERKTRGEGSVGKIRIESAESQALDSFSSGADGGYQRPLVAVVGTQKIKVETVSWLGAIARRYGLDDQHKGLGRTAMRRGRPILSH